jgi:tetratricopeptide (TPR) repeat protein
MARTRASKKRPPNLEAQIGELDGLMAGQQWPEAQSVALSLFEAAPTAPGLLERAVVVLRQLEQWQQLADLMLEARNRYGLWAEGSELLLGQALLNQGNAALAQTYLEEALEQDGATGWAHHFLGKVYRQQGQFQEALDQQHQASDALHDFPWAPFEAAELLLELHRPLEAALELKEAQRRCGDPSQEPLLMQLQFRLEPALAALEVDALLQAGQQDQALSALRRALLMHPSDQGLLERGAGLLAPAEKPLDGNSLTELEQELQSFELLLGALESELESLGF